MSKCPCPDKLKRIALLSPVSLHLRASSIAADMACEDSGAGVMPSDRAKATASRKTSNCYTVRALISPCFATLLTCGAIP